VSVRLESSNAPQRLLREIRGVHEPHCPRHDDPHDLTNRASLFTFVGAGKGGSIWHGVTLCGECDHVVIGHADGAFIAIGFLTCEAAAFPSLVPAGCEKKAIAPPIVLPPGREDDGCSRPLSDRAEVRLS